MFWLKQKRTLGYRDPCDTEENDISTSSLGDCPTCTYFPSMLKEVKCITNSLPNVRGKTSCKYSIDGDCIDVHATITVMKIQNGQPIEHDVSLKVGCACKLLPVT